MPSIQLMAAHSRDRTLKPQECMERSQEPLFVNHTETTSGLAIQNFTARAGLAHSLPPAPRCATLL